MKVVFTMEEVREILLRHATQAVGAKMPAESLGKEAVTNRANNLVTFVHEYSDGSGTMDVETITSVARVEVLIL